MNITFSSRIIGVSLILVFGVICYLMHSLCHQQSIGNLESILGNTKERIRSLNYRIENLDQRKSRAVIDKHASTVTLFLITPTYRRFTQQADLVRLSYTLKHVSNLYWIIVEDSETKTDLVAKVLKESGLKNIQLNIKTRKDLVRGKDDPRWKKHRGVDQRNHGLAWIRQNINKKRPGVVYFADDDNTYHLSLFQEMRSTNKVSMWPVALVGGLRLEGPVCKNRKVIKFFTGWKPERRFPVDMAAFAINLQLLFKYPKANINPEVSRGFLETDFLEQFDIAVDDVEAKADDCSKILVWHTQTAEPKMKQEIRLQQLGMGSDPRIIV